MEEMQKAFNKTIIKLQNTSRIAEEQVSNDAAQMLTEFMFEIVSQNHSVIIHFDRRKFAFCSRINQNAH